MTDITEVKDFPSPEITATYSLGLKYKCSKCPETFSTLSNFLAHKQHHSKYLCDLHPSKKPYRLTDKSSRSTDYQDKREENSVPEIYKCKKCPLTFTKEFKRRKHQSVHGTAFYCKLCLVGLHHQQRLVSHWKTVHPEATKDGWKNKNPQPISLVEPVQSQDLKLASIQSEYLTIASSIVKCRCTKCGLTFPTLEQANAHKKINGLECEKAPCGLCPAVFATVAGSKKHRQKIHGDHTDFNTSSAQDLDTRKEPFSTPTTKTAEGSTDVSKCIPASKKAKRGNQNDTDSVEEPDSSQASETCAKKRRNSDTEKTVLKTTVCKDQQDDGKIRVGDLDCTIRQKSLDGRIWVWRIQKKINYL